jgi:hypothetical protein
LRNLKTTKYERIDVFATGKSVFAAILLPLFSAFAQ